MKYEPVIGLEFHVQLKTRSKQFCSCKAAVTRELADANKHVCPVCLGHPGVLPVLNEESVLLAMLFGLRVNGEIARRSIFARKQYFYPDLPKGYQITQYQTPLVSGGELEFRHGGITKTASLQRAHLEEDTAKIFYQPVGGLLLDYSRAGVPLLEIVTKPCFSSPEEAVAFAVELRIVLRSLGVSDASMEDGSFRCEPNISVRPKGSRELRTKTEVKNLNSFAVMRKALESEYRRQVAEYESGGSVSPWTMRWDEADGGTVPMRAKETQADYRYFDEPDLPPLILDDAQFQESQARLQGTLQLVSIGGVSKRLPAGNALLVEYLVDVAGLSEDAALLLADDQTALRLFQDSLNLLLQGNPGIADAAQLCLNLVVNLYRPLASEGEGKLNAGHIAELAVARHDKKLTSSQVKEALAACFREGISVSEAKSRLGFDEAVPGESLSAICAEIIAGNEKTVADIRKGKAVALQVLVGQVMKSTRGKARPEEALAELKRLIGLE